MPRGRGPDAVKSEPLSSLATAALSSDTRRALADAGLSSFQISEIRTESAALAVLALRAPGDNPEEYAPSCFRRKYCPDRPLCRGCVFSAKCWAGDNRYLRAVKAGKAGRPPAPDHVVDEVLGAVKSKRRPPKPRVRR